MDVVVDCAIGLCLAVKDIEDWVGSMEMDITFRHRTWSFCVETRGQAWIGYAGFDRFVAELRALPKQTVLSPAAARLVDLSDCPWITLVPGEGGTLLHMHQASGNPKTSQFDYLCPVDQGDVMAIADAFAAFPRWW